MKYFMEKGFGSVHPYGASKSLSSFGTTLTFNNIANVPVANASSVSDWNTFFDLPAYGNPFTSVSVYRNEVTLMGGSGITLKGGLFSDSSCSTSLIKLEDTDCVVDMECEFVNNEEQYEFLILSPFRHRYESGEGIIDNYCYRIVEIDLPSIMSIGDNAFYGCSSLASLIIGDGVTSIGDNAFFGCSSLASITIPDSVTSIGDSAFSYCSSLTSITIPDGVTGIGRYAFQDCDALTSITIPDGVTSIGEYTFVNCSSLTSITIPDSVTTIGEYAFYGCSSLASITIPDSVTSIGEYAFVNCSSFTTVNMYPITAPTVDAGTTFGDYAATLHIQAGSTGYDVAPWTDTNKFASIVQDL